MTRTDAQKKAIKEAKKKLDQARKHVASGGSRYSWSNGGSSGGGSKTVPYDFIGPLQPDTIREDEPVVYQGPVQPGADVGTFRKTGETISPEGGQILKPKGGAKPLSVEAYDSNDDSVYSQGYGAAIIGGVGALGRNIKQFFTGNTHDYEDIGAGFDYVDLKRDRPTSIPRFGTISDQDTGAFIIYGDIQKDIEIERMTASIGARGSAESQISEIQKEYQGQIDTGAMTLEEAEKGFEKDVTPIQERFQLQVADIYKETPDVPGLYSYGGTETKKMLGTGLDIVGYGLATAVAGPAGTIGYGWMRGISLASKGDTKDIRTMDMGIAELSPESKQAGLHLGMAAFGGIGLTGKIAKQIDVLRLQEGVASESGTIGQLYDVDSEKWLKTFTKQKTPYFESTTIGDVQVISKKGGEFALASGKGTQTVKFLPFSEQIGSTGWKTSTTDFGMVGRGFSGRAIVNDITLPGKYSASLGEGYIIRPGKDGYTSFKFAGTSKDAGKFYAGKGGKLVKARMYADDLRMTVIPDMKDTSIILKEIAPSLDDVGLTYIKSGGKGMGVLEQVSPQIQEIGGGYSAVVSKTVTKDVITTLVKQTPTVSFSAPSAYAGLGIYEQTGGGMIMNQTKAPQMNLAVGGLVKPMVDTLSGKDVRQGKVIISGVSSALIHSPIMEDRVTQSPISSIINRQLSGQKLKQQLDMKPIGGFGTPAITPPFIPSPVPPIGGGWGLPLIKFPSVLIGKRKAIKRITGFGSTWVGSSYAAKVFDIRSKKEGKGTFGKIFTGMEIKPLTLGGKARVRKKETKKKKKR